MLVSCTTGCMGGSAGINSSGTRFGVWSPGESFHLGVVLRIPCLGCFMCPSAVKEYARAEGVLAKLGVASELVIDLSRENRVSETEEYCEKVPCTSARPHVDLIPGGNGTGTRLTRADT
jgi:hypothetical protein